MHIEPKDVAGVTHHVVVGELDADNCHELQRLEDGHGGDGTAVSVDLTQVTFLDSSALSELLRIKTAVEDAGAGFKIIDVSPPVRRVFEITGLVSAFGLT